MGDCYWVLDDYKGIQGVDRVFYMIAIIVQGSSNLVLEGQCPGEFSSNSHQTHLNNLIKVFRITIKSQVGEFDQGLS